MFKIVWTEYFQYRVKSRKFDLRLIEDILRFSSERYYDVETDRSIAVGKHRDQLIMIPYERDDFAVTPITVHATTRQQIRYRVKTGRFIINV